MVMLAMLYPTLCLFLALIVITCRLGKINNYNHFAKIDQNYTLELEFEMKVEQISTTAGAILNILKLLQAVF